MGLDISQIFGQAESAASQGFNDLKDTAGQAALGYLEGQAVNLISADQESHNAASAQASSNILARPTSAGSFGAYMANLVQSPAMKQYGPYVIGAAVVFMILGKILG